MKKPLKGVLPPVITPFKNEELDLEAFKSVISRFNQTGLSGYLVAGSNGEAVFLNDAERDRVWAAAKETAAEDKIIMAGAGRESTRGTIAAVKRAAELGADCALVVTPHYFKGQMTPDNLAGHYTRVAEAAEIPVLLYNFPQATGVNMEPELVARLAGHPNIVGIKDSSGNVPQLSRIISLTPDDFAVFVGSAEAFFPALCLGAQGAILALANAVPELCVELMDHYQAGRLDQARALQFGTARLAALVTRVHGVGGLKAVMAKAGYQAGTVRSPLSMPGPKALAELEAELAQVTGG